MKKERISQHNDRILEIARRTGRSILDVKEILKEYINIISNEAEIDFESYPPLRFGVLQIDSLIKCYPGITLIYSQSDMGKTSLLKKIAVSLSRQDKTVLYLDAENKLYLHQLDGISDVIFTSEPAIAKEMVETGLIDVIIVDTVSSIPANTMKSFMTIIRKKVEIIILGVQMRVDMDSRKQVPACSDGIKSTAHTHIYITESEKIKFESLDMRRVQFSIMKYDKDFSVIRKRSSFVIFENIVNNFWSAVDYLHSIGTIRAFGQKKFLNDTLIGKYSEVIKDEKIVENIITSAWSSMYDGESREEYIEYTKDDILWRRGTLPEMQIDRYEDESDDISSSEEELTSITIS